MFHERGPGAKQLRGPDLAKQRIAHGHAPRVARPVDGHARQRRRLHPQDARRASALERVERGVEVAAVPQRPDEHDRVLEGHGAALRECGRARVRGVADQHAAAPAPRPLLDVEIAGRDQRGLVVEPREDVRRRAAEARERLAHALELAAAARCGSPDRSRAAVHLGPGSGCRSSVRPLPSMYCGCGSVGRARRDEPPAVKARDRLRRRRPEQLRAELRVHAVGRDDQLVAAAAAVAERDLDVRRALLDRSDRRCPARRERRERRQQQLLQRIAPDAHEFRPVAARAVDVKELTAGSSVKRTTRTRRPRSSTACATPSCLQHAQRVAR